MIGRRFWLFLVGGWLLCGVTVVQATPKVQSFQGPGGMTVFLVESHANPMVEVRLVARGGAAYDPPGKGGVASLTAWMFNEGSTEMDSATFQEQLAFHGILLDASATLETLTVRLTTRTEHLEESWSRLADGLLRPRLAEKDFAQAMDEQRAQIIKDQEQPQTRASLRLHRMLYPDHPYGLPVVGTLESLARITLADVRRFQTDAFHTPDMVLAVAGDLDLPRLQGLINRHLSGLNSQPSPLAAIPSVPADPPVGGAKTERIEMDLPQTTLLLGTIGIRRQDPDYYAFYVLNQLLGGAGLNSRLSTEIREKRGLTYGVYSHFVPLSNNGPFFVVMKTKTESTNEALALLNQELQRLTQEGVSETELQEVIRYLTGSFPLHLDGLGKISALWGSIGYYRLGLDYLDKWPDRIRAVTRDDILRVARRLLEPQRFDTVIVGKSP